MKVRALVCRRNSPCGSTMVDVDGIGVDATTSCEVLVIVGECEPVMVGAATNFAVTDRGLEADLEVPDDYSSLCPAVRLGSIRSEWNDGVRHIRESVVGAVAMVPQDQTDTPTLGSLVPVGL